MVQLMQKFGPKALDALIQWLEENLQLEPGSLAQEIDKRIDQIPDYEWMKQEVQEIMAKLLELKGMTREEFSEAVKSGFISRCLKDLFEKCDQLKDAINGLKK